MRRSPWVLLGALVAWLLLPAPLAHAAEAVVQAQRPPHYVGDPILIRVTAAGFEETPAPTCTAVSDTPGVTLEFVEATPSVSSMVQIVNGHRSEERTVKWVFDFHATAAKPGTYDLGPFRVTQGSQTVSTGRIRISPQAVPLDPDMSISMHVSEKPVYPGQRVDVEITWRYAGDLDAVDDLTIRAPLFDRFPFEDEPLDRRDTALPLTTAKGVVRVKATAERTTVAGKAGVVIKARRKLVPDRSGRFRMGPITASMNKVVRWRRTLFGDREPVEARRVRAEGQPLTLVVKDLPSTGRPESFAGAIGHGFTLAVSADRTVVRLGDPIALTLKLRGDGNLETLGLPPLSADGGLDPAKWGLPDGEVPGTIEDGVKTFQVTVRVRSKDLHAIPAIAYSWFDPRSETYQTTRSSPIALQVEDVKIVSARDVVSTPRPAERHPGAPTPADASPAPPRFDVTGADLSMETDASTVLVGEDQRFGGPLVRVILYVLGGVLVALAFAARRRAQLDPEVRRVRALLAEQRARLAGAARLGAAEGGRAAAAALRALGPDVPATLKAEFEDAAAALDAAAYAPGAAQGTVDPQLLERARMLLDRAAREMA